MGASLCGVVGEIPLLSIQVSNRVRQSGYGTVLGRQFDWGGRLLNSNGGARRSPCSGWKSGYKCKGIRWLDCESDRTSRYESRS